MGIYVCLHGNLKPFFTIEVLCSLQLITMYEVSTILGIKISHFGITKNINRRVAFIAL